MLDIQLFRTDPDRVAQGIAAKKGDPAAVQTVVDLDTRRRDRTYRVEQLKKERNDTSKSIGKIMKEGGDAEPIKARMREVGDEIKALDEEVNAIGDELREVLLRLPALPHEATPVGAGEEENVYLRDWGEQPTLDVEPKPHWELGETLGILDSERGAALSGSGFFLLKGQGARLQRALINFMLDMHVDRHGYTEARVPYVVNRQTITGTGQVPKSEFDMYRIESDDLFLIPTAEVPVTNFHAGDILMAQDLPKTYCAYTPCFRREAGAAGKDTRGMLRTHQFDKVEMVRTCLPEESYNEFDKLLSHAEDILQALGLHYRVLELCTGDIALQATKCYDLEVWAPGVGKYLEVSSVSNCEDFQARRASIRFRREKGAKPEFCHTLNGSGVALPRLMVAVIETYQQADGTILLPEAIQSYMGCDRIG